MQILPDLYQIAGSLNGQTGTGDYGTYSDASVYVLKTAAGLILFDTGNGETTDRMFDWLRLWRLDPADIRVCFLTHAHWDHAGGVPFFKRLGVKIFASQATAESLAAADERCCGFLYHKTFPGCTIDETLSDRQSVEVCGETITPLHLPGHTAGCMAYTFLHGGKTVVVSGDVIGTLMDGYFGWNGSIDFDKRAYLDSLRRFAQFDSDLMLPGHGLVYWGRPRSRVETALERALSEWR